jgi:catechol 2,3-dioxygenase
MTRIGPVSLTVSDLSRTLAFYTERLGFRVHHRGAGEARIGAGGDDLVELVESKGSQHAPGTTGLFHVAVLLPSREALADALAHLVDTRTPLQGASDHLVSESLYLADSEGNGIELYRDRPREEWAWQDGAVRMTTDPLDVAALQEEAVSIGSAWSGLPARSVIGHVHLRVAHIVPAERFYCDLLGFDLTKRYGTMASFVSFDGYHHHVAFNTWGGVGAPAPPAGALGLREFVVRFADAGEVERVVARVRDAGVSVAGTSVCDPSGNRVRLTVGGGAP